MLCCTTAQPKRRAGNTLKNTLQYSVRLDSTETRDEGRTADIPPNLCTWIGWLIAGGRPEGIEGNQHEIKT